MSGRGRVCGASLPISLLLLMVTLTSSAWPQRRKSAATSPPPLTVYNILLHDTLQPASVQNLQDELATANAQRPAAILLDLSTPGGWSSSADAMVRLIQQSATPVVVYLREPGTQVAGEGLRLLTASRVTVMHPQTLLVPLASLRHGSAVQRARREAERAALADALAASLERRGKSAEMLRELLHDAAPITAQEAQESGLITAIATKDEAALQALQSSATNMPPNLASAHVVNLPLSARQHLSRALMNPDLTVLLLTLGALLIFLEINTPGTVLPGAAGVLLVLLSMYALLQMPLRWQGVLLVLLSAGLLLAETQFARGSAYGVGAVVALTLGLRLLVRGPIPELEVDWSTSIGAGLGFGGIAAGLVLLGMRARRAKVKTGAEAMLGWLAVAQTPLEPTGEVLVRGELWRAQLSAGNSFLPAGECVKVQGTDGTTLEVSPMTLNLQEAEAAV